MKYTTLVLATGNPNKVEEMKELLAGLDIKLIPSSEFSDMPEVIEDADTLEGNAQKKAIKTFEYTGLSAVADDTGLEVDALKGRPGVYSARYAGDNATYQDNVERLLHELRGISEIDRTARFRTVLALKDEQEMYFFKGVCEGTIAKSPRGRKGFGYDPVFCPSGQKLTFGEMSSDQKNSISHRGKALKALRIFLGQQAD